MLDSDLQWNLNEGITSEKDRSYLWNNVILKVQQGQADLAHENFVKFIKKWIPEGFTGPVALSCTELPIAAVRPYLLILSVSVTLSAACHLV